MEVKATRNEVYLGELVLENAAIYWVQELKGVSHDGLIMGCSGAGVTGDENKNYKAGIWYNQANGGKTKVQFYDCSKVNQCQLKQLISCMAIGNNLIEIFIVATFFGYFKKPIHKFLGFRYDPGRENVLHLYWIVYTQISDEFFFKWEFIDIIMSYARKTIFLTKEDLRFRDEDYLEDKVVVTSWCNDAENELSMRPKKWVLSFKVAKFPLGTYVHEF